jgi:hypothetical protein
MPPLHPMRATGPSFYVLITLLSGVNLLSQHAAADMPPFLGVSLPQLQLRTTEHVKEPGTAYGSYGPDDQQSCTGLKLSHEQEPPTCMGDQALPEGHQEEPPAEPSSCLEPQPHPLAVTMGSRAAARRLQQAGTTTLRPNSAPTRCLDTLGNYVSPQEQLPLTQCKRHKHTTDPPCVSLDCCMYGCHCCRISMPAGAAAIHLNGPCMDTPPA